jgi:hypothetical protein
MFLIRIAAALVIRSASHQPAEAAGGQGSTACLQQAEYRLLSVL